MTEDSCPCVIYVYQYLNIVYLLLGCRYNDLTAFRQLTPVTKAIQNVGGEFEHEIVISLPYRNTIDKGSRHMLEFQVCLIGNLT